MTTEPNSIDRNIEQFYKAAEQGDLAAFKSLLGNYFGLFATKGDKESRARQDRLDGMTRYHLMRVLKLAAYNGHLPIISFMIEHILPSSFDRVGILRAAIHNGHLPIVKYLANIGVNLKNYDSNALNLALERGHVPVVDFLLKQGFSKNDIHARDLQQAAKNGHFHLVRYMVERLGIDHSDGGRHSALRAALRHQHVEICQYLFPLKGSLTVLKEKSLISGQRQEALLKKILSYGFFIAHFSRANLICQRMPKNLHSDDFRKYIKETRAVALFQLRARKKRIAQIASKKSKPDPQ